MCSSVGSSPLSYLGRRGKGVDYLVSSLAFLLTAGMFVLVLPAGDRRAAASSSPFARKFAPRLHRAVVLLLLLLCAISILAGVVSLFD